MNCREHGKSIVGNCLLCGKDLCKLCIAHVDGKKLYCRSCYMRIKDMQLRKREPIQPTKPSILKKKSEYFDFSVLKK